MSGTQGDDDLVGRVPAPKKRTENGGAATGATREDPVGEKVGKGVAKESVLRVGRRLSIPLGEIAWRATTPGGPGGQHANRTASRVEVRFDVEASTTLSPRQRAVLLARFGPVVVARSATERSQARNRQLALERLARRLTDALRTQPARRPTVPTRAARARRLDEKRRRAATKRARRTPGPED